MIKDGNVLHDDVGVQYAHRKRIMENKEAFSALERAVVLTEVHFGQEIAKQIREMSSFLNDVIVANDMLGPDALRYDPQFKQLLERERQSLPKQDDLGEKIKASKKLIRSNLIYYMRIPGEVDRDALKSKRFGVIQRLFRADP